VIDATLLQEITSSDWRQGLPVLPGQHLTLRELRMDDAASLLSMMNTHEVARFMSPPSSTVEGFEAFIQFTHDERAAGKLACYGIVPEGYSTAIGIFQVRSVEGDFTTAEWGFAMGSAFWGTGLFAEGARLVLEFAFSICGVHRLEARAAVANGRGNGALRKIGAIQEGTLRRSFLRDGVYHDQVLWSILADDWRFQRIGRRAIIH
jgi:ribosomal-protein-alanine N-acetyltransferase